MKDDEKSRAQLVGELTDLRRRVVDLEGTEAECRRVEDLLAKQTAELSRISEILADKDRLLASFHQVGQAILSPLDLDQILDNLAEQIVNAGVFRSLMVALVDEETHSVEVVRSLTRHTKDGALLPSGRPSDRKVVGIRYDLDDENITAEVARTGEIQVIEEWDERFDRKVDRPEWSKGQASYFIPVKKGDQVLAVLATGSVIEDKEAVLNRIDAMRPLLDQVAIALEHARLYEEVRQYSDAQREAEQMRVLAETAVAAAHEINQPLTAIVGHAELMLMQMGADDPLRSTLEAVREAGLRISETVHKMRSARRYVTTSYVRGVDMVDFDAAAEEGEQSGEEES